MSGVVCDDVVLVTTANDIPELSEDFVLRFPDTAEAKFRLVSAQKLPDSAIVVLPPKYFG